MNKTPTSVFLNLNLALLFIATSGVLGKWIDLPPAVSIFWRSFLAIPFLVLFLKWSKQSLRPILKWNRKLFLASVLMGTHWVTYFYALQWSNVAVGMLSLFTFPVITAFLEPLFFTSRLRLKHLFLGAITLLGIYFLIPSVELAQVHGKAVALGVFSALCYALRNLILKTALHQSNGSQMMLTQVLIIALCFSPFLSFDTLRESLDYGWALLFLALFTTVIGHTLFLNSLQYFSVTTASIVACIQPLYGILIAYVVLGEVPHSGTLIGGALILLAVFVEGRSIKTNNK